jgi:transcriptional regulator with XRE-family HTH domain
MIRNDNEHAQALRRIEEEEVRLQAFEREFSEEFAPEQVARLMEPLITFREQLLDEVKVYERLRRGDLGDLNNLEGMGRLLIHIRIARGVTQRELADRLGVNESQVSRDERNEYHGITMDRATRVLDALEARLLTSVVAPAAASLDRTKPIWQPRTPKTVVTAPAEETVLPSGKVPNADLERAA